MNYVVGIFALVIGISAFWGSYKILTLYFKVKKWDIVSAKVIHKEVFEHKKYSSSATKYGIRVNYVLGLGIIFSNCI